MLNDAAKTLFPLDPEVAYLDHGGFGVTPHSVAAARARAQARVEAAPRAFFDAEFRPAWMAAAARVATRFGARAQDVALVENATEAIVAVLRAMALQPGDEVLVTSRVYGGVALAAEHVLRPTGARLVRVALPFPPESGEAWVAALSAAIGPRTRLAVIDHITSSTALVAPVSDMAKACRERGVAVLVDGAHAPGQVALDLPALGADWYAGNLHKWSFVPRGCGFLWARPERRDALVPAVPSWGLEEPSFPANFWWTGTRDPSIWMAIPAAFDFVDQWGEAAIRAHNHALIVEAARVLGRAWGVAPPAPEAMTGAMTLVPLPGRSAPTTEESRAAFQAALWRDFRIACPCLMVDGRAHLRISAQIYNDMADYERLAQAVARM
ncbi:MAG: aminotransferase [Methylocystis sp.]|nr:MAG: aminotransferase [Methylocystis sp.]